jgi:hypothetical protein
MFLIVSNGRIDNSRFEECWMTRFTYTPPKVSHKALILPTSMVLRNVLPAVCNGLFYRYIEGSFQRCFGSAVNTAPERCAVGTSSLSSLTYDFEVTVVISDEAHISDANADCSGSWKRFASMNKTEWNAAFTHPLIYVHWGCTKQQWWCITYEFIVLKFYDNCRNTSKCPVDTYIISAAHKWYFLPYCEIN